MAQIDKKYLKAFTLFESVISVTIISVLIGVSALIWGNLMDSDKPLSYFQAKENIDLLLHELKHSKAFIDRTFEYDTYSIEQHLSFHKGNKKLYQVEYKVIANNKQWWTEKQLVSNPFYEKEI